jgi:glucokinase
LGRASYRAIFALIAAGPPGSTAIVDAWFGFQPRELLAALLAEAGVDAVVEIWCHATADIVAARYRDRADGRLPGHPGPEYAEELRLLATNAAPMALGPVHAIDTSRPLDPDALRDFIDASWQ